MADPSEPRACTQRDGQTSNPHAPALGVDRRPTDHVGGGAKLITPSRDHSPHQPSADRPEPAWPLAPDRGRRDWSI